MGKKYKACIIQTQYKSIIYLKYIILIFNFENLHIELFVRHIVKML